MKLAMAFAFLLLLGLGCQEPRTAAVIPESRPRIAIHNAPASAILFVDGREIGKAGEFNGDPKVLLMEVGTHLVEVKVGDRSIVSQRVFLGGAELRTIVIPN